MATAGIWHSAGGMVECGKLFAKAAAQGVGGDYGVKGMVQQDKSTIYL